MNHDHAELCSSQEWAEHIAETVLPAALDAVTLGDEVLEIGPGYGASTRQLVDKVPRLTAVEVDAALAKDLASTYPSVTVIEGSGDDLPFDDARFSAVVCFTMLHHVLSPQMQDGLFAEAHRVLQPGGVFAGSDSIDNADWREFHGDDTCVPVDPTDLPRRLASAGFTDVDVRIVAPDEWFTFSARA
jgi:ubiquinone/menaquinone biosynthesis C-methylase UbiE